MIHQNAFRRTASPIPSQWFEQEEFGEIDRESPNYVGWLTNLAKSGPRPADPG